MVRMTDLAVLLPYLVFCVLMTGSPGPNNTMALTAGVAAGYWRSLPLVAGIALGFGVLFVAVGLGLGAVFQAHPPLHTFLKVAGTLYLLVLAWKIATSGPIPEDTAGRPPVGFFGAALFQWVNPKAWAVTTSAVAAYVPPVDYRLNIVVAAAIICVVAVPCLSVWVAGGTVLRRFLVRPAYARVFNGAVAALLALSTVPILTGV